MGIQLGNLRTFTALGDKGKMQELENKLVEMGYQNEDNCERNEDKEKLTWHIYDMPRNITFSFLTPEALELLKSYSKHFHGRVGVSGNT